MTNMDVSELLGKTISKIEIDGYGITLATEDGCLLEYNASDGGYSSYGITQTEEGQP